MTCTKKPAKATMHVPSGGGAAMPVHETPGSIKADVHNGDGIAVNITRAPRGQITKNATRNG